MVASMDATWRMAVTATRHCLTGCAIGEVLGMLLTTWWDWGNTATIALSVVLAFFFGYLLTFTGVRRAGADRRTATRAALASDTVSILTMEIVDNVFLLFVPGAMAATLDTALFWWSLAVSLAVAFVAAVPVNHWLMVRGKGHAVVHQLHEAHADHH
jgi:ABC-type nitrate/sulfonate/bicarbonate transport system permease component